MASGADRLDDVLDEPATQRMVAHLDAMLARHAAGEPLAYVLGRWSFRHLDLIVDRRVLIPRPETEVVAGVAIDLARAEPRPVTVADLGTGSGAIGLALADELPVDGVTVWLTDVVARRPRRGPGQPRRHRPAGGERAHRRWLVVRRLAGRRRARRRRGQPAVRRRRIAARSTSPCGEWEPHERAVRRRRRSRRHPASSSPRRPDGSGPAAGSSSRSAPIRGRPSSACSATAATATSSIRPDLAGRDRVAVARLP